MTAPTLGINQSNLTQLTPADLDRVCADIAAFGFSSVRFSVNWGSTATWLGPSDFTRIQRVADALMKYQLTPLPILGITKPWGADASVKAFGVFVTRCTNIFGAIPAYEVWNEPNLFNFWGGTPAQFLPYLRAAAPIIRAKGAKVIHGGLAAYADSRPFLVFTNYSPTTWLTKLYAAGEDGDYDLLGYHPYPLNVAGAWSPNLSNAWGIDQITAMDDVRAAQQDSRPYAFTEVGFDTTRVGLKPAAAELEPLLVKLPAPESNTWLFCWRDTTGDGGSFGLVTSGNVPKRPLYDTARGLL